jgi:hypothetical protein
MDETAALQQIASHLRGKTRWKDRVETLGKDRYGLHLAVLVEPYLQLLLDGEKTVESRFARVKCPPHGVIRKGDTVLLKKSGGPVVGAFRVGAVWSYEIDADSWDDIQLRFSKAICPQGDDFWGERQGARFATLMKVQCVATFEPVNWPKRDRRGWVVISPPKQTGLF